MQYWKHKPLPEQTPHGLIVCFCYKNLKYRKPFPPSNILLHLTADKNQFCSFWQKQRKTEKMHYKKACFNRLGQLPWNLYTEMRLEPWDCVIGESVTLIFSWSW